MQREINLLRKYPQAKRDLTKRVESKSEEVREIARKFDKDFFDGDRNFGYGGFSYNPKYWTEVVKDFVEFYNLKDGSKILDVGCAKGYMLFDFKKLNPNFKLYGIDVSSYAIENSKEEVKNCLKVANAKNLEFEDDYFDLVISINTIHNLEKKECLNALKEIQRVTKKNSFITVDAFRDEEEKQKMYAWNLTAKTIMSVDEWKEFFNEANFKGDYYWFIP
jgi:ubiquinone/menaquinone biosynthesis C-methylase UbiE